MGRWLALSTLALALVAGCGDDNTNGQGDMATPGGDGAKLPDLSASVDQAGVDLSVGDMAMAQVDLAGVDTAMGSGDLATADLAMAQGDLAMACGMTGA